MKRRGVLSLLFLWPWMPSAISFEYKRDDLIGAWSYEESYLTFPDGRRLDQFGTHPKGIFIILPNGRYSHIIMRDDLPKIRSGIMMQATPDEARSIAIGALAHFGTWEANEKEGTFVAHVEWSDFPNLKGQDQTRVILELDRDTLRYTNDVTNAGPGAVVHARLRRVW